MEVAIPCALHRPSERVARAIAPVGQEVFELILLTRTGDTAGPKGDTITIEVVRRALLDVGPVQNRYAHDACRECSTNSVLEGTKVARQTCFISSLLTLVLFAATAMLQRIVLRWRDLEERR